MMEGFEGGYIPQGWQCPICKTVYAPGWPFCTVCGKQETTTVTEMEVGTTKPRETFPNDAYQFVREYEIGRRRDDGE